LEVQVTSKPKLAARLSEWGLIGGTVIFLAVLHAQNLLDSDEGLVLAGAWNILHGLKPYEDFFEFIPPASFYLVAAAWKAFGVDYWVAKGTAVAAIVVGAAGVGLTSRLLIGGDGPADRRVLLAGPIVFCMLSGYWPAVNHNVYNISVVIWGGYFATRALQRRSVTDAAIAGFVTGIAALFLLHRTAALVAAFLLGCMWMFAKDRDAFWLRGVGAFLVASALPSGCILLFWAPELLFEAIVLFPARQYLAVNRVDMSLFMLVAVVALAVLWLLRRRLDGAVLFVGILLVTLLLTSLQRPDFTHISLALFPLLSLHPVLLAETQGAPRGCRLLTHCLSMLGIAAALPALVFVGARNELVINVPARLASLRFVKEHCGGSPFIYAGPFAPGLYFETGKLNATRYSLLLSSFNTPDQLVEARDDLEANSPSCVLTAYALGDKFMHSRANPVDTYIAEHYEPAIIEGQLQVWTARALPR
jgi:hypothetical protein